MLDCGCRGIDLLIDLCGWCSSIQFTTSAYVTTVQQVRPSIGKYKNCVWLVDKKLNVIDLREGERWSWGKTTW